MAFGGFFGGGSSKDNSSSSTTSSSPSSDSSSTSITNPLSSSFSPSSGSTTTTTPGVTLQRIQSAISEQSNVANAKQLISNVHTNCFEKCVPNPGSSLSSTEQKCLTACMEKYIDAWNVTSRTYTARLQRESASFAGGIAAGSEGAGGGKELF